MIRIALAMLLVLVLSGASCQRRPVAPVGDAAAICYAACTPSLLDTGVRWEAEPEDPAAFDELGETVVPLLGGKLLACEARRQACVDFLQALKRRGVYRAEP